MVDEIVVFAAEYRLDITVVVFASSIMLVDVDSNALARVITYEDSWCAPYVADLCQRVDERAYHQRTGVRLHTSYHPADRHRLGGTARRIVASGRVTTDLPGWLSILADWIQALVVPWR